MKNEEYCVMANDIEIWAKIGLHKEEHLVENCFKVSVKVQALSPYEKNKYLDYETIVKKVQLVFGRSHSVLEDLCIEIINEIASEMISEIKSIGCSIKKINPSLKGIRVGELGVEIIKQF